MGSMRGAEGIHDEDVAKGRKSLRKRRIVRRLAGLEPDVLKQHDIGQANVDAVPPVVNQPDGAPEGVTESLGDRP